MQGTVFDIKEFALNDGGGIRTTVFLKGCPLRCVWCHNPEGLKAEPELYIRQNGCLQCGLCRKPCGHPECKPFGRCLHVCPGDLIGIKGERWESEALADKLLETEVFFRETGGGVTVSGGEPLMQADFCEDFLKRLGGRIHRAIETSGYAEREDFERVIKQCDFVYMDLKLMDRERHREYTGVGNEKILANAEALKGSGKEYCFRVPLIPGITDTEENLGAIAAFAGESGVELLPYNEMAGAKYKSVGRRFSERVDAGNAEENRERWQRGVTLFRNAKLRK